MKKFKIIVYVLQNNLYISFSILLLLYIVTYILEFKRKYVILFIKCIILKLS